LGVVAAVEGLVLHVLYERLSRPSYDEPTDMGGREALLDLQEYL
jgi:hypothetical protein